MGGRESMDASRSSYPKLVERPVGKQIHNIYLDRLRQFTSTGQYEKQGLMGYV
jgi:alpha-mannosidase